MSLRMVLSIVAVVLCFGGWPVRFGPKMASAQGPSAVWDFPQDPALWINSPPLSKQWLQGKGTVLWFYDEQCPTARGRWPKLLETAKKYEGQPVGFIAVSSGLSRAEVEHYVHGNGITWPVIVDTTRELERHAGVATISLQNIYQARVLTAEGNLLAGSWSDFEKNVTVALHDAKWNVDPSNIPASLKGTWSAVEFGNYPAAASALKKALASTKPEIKEASTKLHQYVQEQLTKAAEEAEKESASDDPWRSYAAYKKVSHRFAGFDLPVGIADKLKTLEQDDAVKSELLRFRQVEAAKKSLASSSQTSRTAAAAKLKKLIKEAPDSESAKAATELLAAAGAE